MKITGLLNGKKVTIEIDKSELTKLKCFKPTLDNLNSYEDACEILDEVVNKTAKPYEKLETIIKAANFIDNDYKIWKANFDDSKEYKYLPYFNKTSGGLVAFSYCHHYTSHACCSGSFYYKNNNTGILFSKKFIDLYNQWLG